NGAGGGGRGRVGGGSSGGPAGTGRRQRADLGDHLPSARGLSDSAEAPLGSDAERRLLEAAGGDQRGGHDPVSVAEGRGLDARAQRERARSRDAVAEGA